MSDSELAADGLPDDGVGHHFATSEHLAGYQRASDALGQFKTPILIHAGNSHERLIVIAFDGTGNNKVTDPKHATNIAKIHDEIEALNQSGNRQIYSRYVEGPGTQPGWLSAATDSLLGHTYEQNIKTAYKDVVRQTNAWVRSDPDAVVRVHSIGFSRGGSQAAGMARYLDEKGIPDLSSATKGADESVIYSRYLIEPGKIVQTMGIFDPVATGVPMKFDRRPPPSLVNGFQMTSSDELRKLFPSDQILPPGLSDDGRFLNVMVPGAHSDVGGGYQRDGLSIRAGNIMRDHLNSLSDTPFLKKEFEPLDERYNVIHRSTEGKLIFRADPREGVRGHSSGTNEILAPRHVQDAGPAPHRAQAVNQSLVDGLAFREVPIGPPNLEPARSEIPTASHEQMMAAARSAPVGPTVRRALGVAATAVDVAETGAQMYHSYKEGNRTALESQGLRFASRNAAGWVGAEAFAAAGTAVGVTSGPGMFVTGAIGGIVGFVGGDKIADAYDKYRVSHQDDSQGNTWRLDEQHGWVRDIPPLPGAPSGGRVTADAALADRLSFQSANTVAELALASEYVPQDPFEQPAAPGDTHSVRDAPWIRDTQTHEWSRRVVDGVLEHGMTSSHVEKASPQRAKELDQLAFETVHKNAAESPIGVAERYRQAYEHEGWARHGPMPDAVGHALEAPVETILASDGKTYTQGKDGDWTRPGALYGTNPADARTREELELSEGAIRGLRTEPETFLAGATPAIPSRLDDPRHPDNALFAQIRGHVVELDKSLGRAPDQHTDNISSALTVQARADGLQRVDQIALSTDGSKIWAVQTPPGRKDHLFDQRTSVPTAEANTPMEKSAERWPDAMQQFHAHAQEHAMSQQRAQDRQQTESQGQGGVAPSMAR